MYSGSTIVITGASAGLGAVFARELAARGAKQLVLVARRKERLEALAAELPCDAVVEAVDLTEPDAVASLIQRHSPDVLVNNAGFGTIGPVLKNSAMKMIDLNIRALTQLVEGWLPGMVERGRGGILNVGSTAGMVATPQMAAYAGSKAYVNLYTDALRTELLGTGVHCTCLAPGPVATEFFEVAAPGGMKPPGFVMQAPEATVRWSLRALQKNRAITIPSLPIWLAIWSRKYSPEWMVRMFMRIYGSTLVSMT